MSTPLYIIESCVYYHRLSVRILKYNLPSSSNGSPLTLDFESESKLSSVTNVVSSWSIENSI